MLWVLTRAVVGEGPIDCDRGTRSSAGRVDIISNKLAMSYRIARMVMTSVDYQPLCGKML